MSRPSNVLFISADQWRGECLSRLGHNCLKTPNLDALAAEGVAFRRHYSQASPCSPGRASLYTGLYLHNHRSVVNGTPLDARHTNLALEARKAGYDPVLFGYTDVSADPRQLHPQDPALRTYEGVLPGMTPAVLMTSAMLPWLAGLRHKGYSIAPDELFRPRDDWPDAANHGATYVPARYRREDSHTAFLTEEAIKYIAVRESEPWFIHISYLSPHPPFIAPEPYHAMYNPEAVPFPVRAKTPEEEGHQHPFLEYYLHHQRDDAYSFGKNTKDNLALDEREIRQLRATYYGMISEVDDQIGHLIKFLKQTGTYDRTLIVFTSDHGELLGDHWQLSKCIYFDQAFHIPLIIRDPELEADGTRGNFMEQFSENIDVTPTILDWLGLEVPSACDGESLLPFLRGRPVLGWREEAHFEFDFRHYRSESEQPILGLQPDECAFSVIRGPRYKYVHFTALPPLFFDLLEDPMEFRNLANESGYRHLVLEHVQKLLSWRMTHDERVLANTRLTPAGVLEHRGPRRT